MSPKNLLTLPGAIRNEIYAHVFTSARKRLLHPWDDGRSCDVYLSVFLTCRQVYLESSSLLWRDHTQDITLNFDNGVTFDSFIQHDFARWPLLHSARFKLRVVVQDKDNRAAEAEQLAPVIELLVPQPVRDGSGSVVWRKGTAVLAWKALQTHAQSYATVHTDLRNESSIVTYRTGKPVMNKAGPTSTLFTWDGWLQREEQMAETKGARLVTVFQPDREIALLQNGFTLDPLPPAGDRARSKVTRECVIIEGRLQDVKLPAYQAEVESVEDNSMLTVSYLHRVVASRMLWQ